MSQRKSEYELVPGDGYFTPAWVTEALLSVELFSEPVWEPACGDGHMSAVLSALGHEVISTDIIDGHDFLRCSGMEGYSRSIITNPPYSNGLADRFVYHALDLTEPVRGKVAMLLPMAWDSAKGRRDIFKDHPAFKAKYTLTKRIRWLNLEQKANGPSQNHAWYVWQWGNIETPRIGWLP